MVSPPLTKFSTSAGSTGGDICWLRLNGDGRLDDGFSQTSNYVAMPEDRMP